MSSCSLKITTTSYSLLNFHRNNKIHSRNSPFQFSKYSFSTTLTFPSTHFLNPTFPTTNNNPNHHHFPFHSASTGYNTANGISDTQNFPAENEDTATEIKDIPPQGSWFSTTKILEQLKRYGAAGILSYGLLNTAYYLTAFLVVWFYVTPVPGKMGYLAAVTRFLKVMAMVWAGSQVTKVFRAAGALALAPFVDRALSWFTVKFKFESRGKAFFTLVGFCLGLAIILFFAVTLLWA